MLSYQHGFHAGNPADVHKHAFELALLSLLIKKARPLTYVESHAGRGRYDLTGAQAQKTGECQAGIGALYDQSGLPTPLSRYRDVVARWNRGEAIEQYPGSPCIAAGALRRRDRLQLFEAHGQEFEALEAAMAPYRQASVQRQDGYDGMLEAFSNPAPHHRLVGLIDPSYELKEDFERAPAFARRLIEMVPDALIMVWYPVLSSGAGAFDASGDGWHSIVRFRAHAEGHRMVGSGVALFGDVEDMRRPIKVLDRGLQAYFSESGSGD